MTTVGRRSNRLIESDSSMASPHVWVQANVTDQPQSDCSSLDLVQLSDQFVDARAIVGSLAPEPPGECPVGGDDEVSTQLESVFSGSVKLTQPTLPEDLHVSLGSLPTPDAQYRSTFEAVGPVARSIGVDEDREWQVVRGEVVVEIVGVGECDHHHGGCVTEFVEPVAHGDGVGCARQSMNVAVKDHHDGFVAVIFQLPTAPVGVGQSDGWGWRADRGFWEGDAQDPMRSVES